MKKIFCVVSYMIIACLSVNAQSKIKDGTISSSALPNANAILELESNNKGLLFPRVALTGTANVLPFSGHVAGMMVYNTATAGDVTPGIYYNNGTAWVRLLNAAVNIYNANGTLTGSRTVTQNGNSLTFSNTQRTTFQNSAGTGIMQSSGTGTRASIGLSTSSGVQFWLWADDNDATQMLSTGNATAFVIGTHLTASPAPIDFHTSNGASGTQRAQISGDGRFNINNTLSIGYGSQQAFSGSERLKVNGSIVTAGNTYPDYVFEDYFNGASMLKADYKFKSIYDTEKFITEHKHLPGVTPATALGKTEEGKFMINVSELSVQSLEKIEELYLHTIEQQKQIDYLQKQITILNEVIKRLNNFHGT